MSRNLLNSQRVATGVSYGAIAHEEHARAAVQKALSKMEPCTVGSVLLFLSSGFAFAPQKAIKEAAKAAGTPQVFGCCAKGLLTEEDWLLDAEGAVAMVFPREHSLKPLSVLKQQGYDPSVIFTLTTPNAATIAVNSSDRPQVGAVTTDEYGHGPFSVWESGRINENEYSQSAFPSNLNTHLVIAEGIKACSPVMQVNRSIDHDLLEIGQMSAANNLFEHRPNAHKDALFGTLCAVSETNDQKSIDQGHYRLHHVVSIDQENQSVKLSGSVKAGRYIFWAKRDPTAAQESIRSKLDTVKENMEKPPLFALMFPNIGRGPEFYDGKDQDLLAYQASFPDTPLIGFYGNGEIAPGQELGGLIRHYASVVAIFC